MGVAILGKRSKKLSLRVLQLPQMSNIAELETICRHYCAPEEPFVQETDSHREAAGPS